MTASTSNLTPMAMSIYGPTKVGKTWFAATAPKPVFIASAQERGWSALPSHKNYENITILPVPLVAGQEELGGNVKEPPKNYRANKKPNLIDDIHRALERIVNEYQTRGWRTVVIDTASMLSGMFVSELSEYGKRELGGKGGGQWVTIQQELFLIRNTLQGLPLHVIWTFHEIWDEDAKQLKPSLTGKNYGLVIAPAVRLTGYLTREDPLVVDEAGKTILTPDGKEQYTTVRGLWIRCPKPPPEASLYRRFEASTSFDHLLAESPVYRPHWDTLAKRLQGVVRVD